MKNSLILYFALVANPLAAAPPAPGAASAPPIDGTAAATAPATATSPAPATDAAGGAVPGPADGPDEQNSYLFGLTFGEQIHRTGITGEVSADAILRGLKDGLAGRVTTPADQRRLNDFVHSVMAAVAARNKAAAEDFLARNGHEKGVKSTPSGLQYRVLVPGNVKAPAPSSSDEVTVNYRGKLLDGTEFDSSYARGTPATFKVDGVIQGWQEALTLMKPGARWQLFVPPELGYGLSARPGIPAGSLLLFEVDLLGVRARGNAGTPAPTPAPGKP